MSGEYRPGGCNIGEGERRLRYRVGAASVVAAVAVVGLVVAFSWPRWILLVTVVPLFGGFLGYYQGREAFCVRFAMAGVYNVGRDRGATTEVEDTEAARADRRKARWLTAKAGGLAILTTVVVYGLVPV